MSEAATHVLPPISRTAQSSPGGTSTSGGAGGRRAEILRITSNSFKDASYPASRKDRCFSCSAGTPRAQAPRQRPRRLPLPRLGRPNSSMPSALQRAGSTVRQGPQPRTATTNRTIPTSRVKQAVSEPRGSWSAVCLFVYRCISLIAFHSTSDSLFVYQVRSERHSVSVTHLEASWAAASGSISLP
jgi:hypothetical protein